MEFSPVDILEDVVKRLPGQVLLFVKTVRCESIAGAVHPCFYALGMISGPNAAIEGDCSYLLR